MQLYHVCLKYVFSLFIRYKFLNKSYFVNCFIKILYPDLFLVFSEDSRSMTKTPLYDTNQLIFHCISISGCFRDLHVVLLSTKRFVNFF